MFSCHYVSVNHDQSYAVSPSRSLFSLSHCLPRAHHCCPVIRVAVDDNSVHVVVVCLCYDLALSRRIEFARQRVLPSTQSDFGTNKGRGSC